MAVGSFLYNVGLMMLLLPHSQSVRSTLWYLCHMPSDYKETSQRGVFRGVQATKELVDLWLAVYLKPL